MFLSGTFFGVSNYTNLPLAPTPSKYNKISFMGNITIDNITIKNRVLLNSEIDKVDIEENPQWDSETILLATFQNQTLNAGNIVDLSSPIISWNIRRREIGTNILKNLGNVDGNQVEYIDYLTQPSKTYQYLIFPETINQVGKPLETKNVIADFYGWYLIDEDTKTTYIFDLNLKSGDISHNTDVTITENYTKYPAVTYGNMNYRKGTVSCMAGEISVDGEIKQSISYIEELESFINNKKPKILKSRKGHIMKVVTGDFSYSHIDEIGLQPVIINFSFTEVGEI